MMQTGVDRAVYSKMVEQRPSMFTNEGRDFKEWAARCGKWWESFRGSSAFRKADAAEVVRARIAY